MFCDLTVAIYDIFPCLLLSIGFIDALRSYQFGSCFVVQEAISDFEVQTVAQFFMTQLAKFFWA